MLTPEMFQIIPIIDISTPEKLAKFKKWQNDDGTIEGLRELYEAQHRLQADKSGADTAPENQP